MSLLAHGSQLQHFSHHGTYLSSILLERLRQQSMVNIRLPIRYYKGDIELAIVKHELALPAVHV